MNFGEKMLIQNAQIYDSRGFLGDCIRFLDGKILEVGQLEPKSGEEVLNARGLLLVPAAIDLNAKVANLNLSKKTLLSLSQKAAQGGAGSVVLMPDFSLDSDCAIELGVELLSSLESQMSAKIEIAANCLNKSGALANLSTLHKMGSCGIFSRSFVDGNLLRRACEYAQMLNVPMFFECWDYAMAANGVMNDGEMSATLGLPSFISLCESAQVAKIAEAVEFFGLKAVFNGLSCARSLEIVEQLKKRAKNSRSLAQVGLCHLFFNESAVLGYNTAFKMRPPLKDEQEQKRLCAALKNGQIDIISALQSEVEISQKGLSFEEATFGVDCIADFWPICYSFLVGDLGLSLERVCELLASNAAEILELKKGILKEGYCADFVLLNPNEKYKINNTNSPFFGYEINAKIDSVFIAGNLIK